MARIMKGLIPRTIRPYKLPERLLLVPQLFISSSSQSPLTEKECPLVED